MNVEIDTFPQWPSDRFPVSHPSSKGRTTRLLRIHQTANRDRYHRGQDPRWRLQHCHRGRERLQAHGTKCQRLQQHRQRDLRGCREDTQTGLQLHEDTQPSVHGEPKLRKLPNTHPQAWREEDQRRHRWTRSEWTNICDTRSECEDQSFKPVRTTRWKVFCCRSCQRRQC